MVMHSVRNKGFTIVELLIVIVVIGILAAITIVAFNGITARAEDTKVRSVASQLEKAIILWNLDSNVLPKGGWSSSVPLSGSGGCTDGTGGWVFTGSYGASGCVIEDILVANKLIPQGLIMGAPKNKAYGTQSDGRYTFMFYPCTAGKYALYWNLASPSADDTASITNVESNGCPASPRTTYGMKAAKLISLNG